MDPLDLPWNLLSQKRTTPDIGVHPKFVGAVPCRGRERASVVVLGFFFFCFFFCCREDIDWRIVWIRLDT